MTTEKADIERGALFNNHTFDLGKRLGDFCNYLLLVDGGILSITIAAYVTASPPPMPPAGLVAIKWGWWLLTFGLIFALTTVFTVLMAQMNVQKKMRKALTAAVPPGLQLHQGGGEWLGYLIRILVIAAFAASVAGFLFLSSGAVRLLRLP